MATQPAKEGPSMKDHRTGSGRRYIAAVWLLLFCLACGTANAELTRAPLLDAAFQLLEKDNIFQRRYNALTGAQVTSLFDTGMPYFFGGRPTKLLMSRYPEFAKRDCWESTDYYQAKKVYVYGLDCMGIMTWIWKQCGLPKLPSMASILNDRSQRRYDLYAGGWNWKFEEKPLPDPAVLYKTLRLGDLLVMRNKYRHIMMYIGTLKDYGFTAEEVPELANYLDYPLVIHCASHPRYGEVIQRYIDEHQDHLWNCLTTDGGVAVSILYVPPEAAPCHEHVQVTDFDYFLLDNGNCQLTIRPTDDPRAFCWHRPSSLH